MLLCTNGLLTDFNYKGENKMKVMKSGLLLVVVVIMLLVTTNAAVYSHFPDVPIDADYAEAVDYLAELGIFTGDDQGNFNPDKTITRAEFATIMVRMAGEEDRAKTVTTSSFSDVPSSHWACGYVTVAVEMGFVNGYGNGKYGPGDTLTYEQGVAIIIRYLGLEDEASESGGWVAGYLHVAEIYKITSNLTLEQGRKLLRKQVAILTHNAISE